MRSISKQQLWGESRLEETLRKEVMCMGKIGRDARTGQFIPVREALRRPATTVVETTKSPKKKRGR